MIKQILDSNLPHNFILIEDSVEASSKFLLKEFIEASTVFSDKTVVLCYEKSCRFLKEELDLEDSTALFINCFIDYSDTTNSYDNTIFEKLAEYVSPNEKITIIVDSLTPLYYNVAVKNIYRDFHRILKKPIKKDVQLIRLVVVVHSDTIDDSEKVLVILNNLATTKILVTPSTIRDKYKIYSTHFRKDGKIVNHEEYCWYDKNQKLQSEEIKISSEVKSEEAIDPNELTTFKLRLEEEEIEARSKLKLPYVRTSENNDSGGKIFYKPDENDDMDEEDPDDDLDI